MEIAEDRFLQYRNLFNRNWPYVTAIVIYNAGFIGIYARYYSEQNITGDLVHHVTTALSQMNLGLFSKDYIYHNQDATGFYSPQQIITLRVLGSVFGNVSDALALMNFLYGTALATIAFLFLRKMRMSPWFSFVMSFLFGIHVTSPLLGGSWGFLSFYTYDYLTLVPRPVFHPYNSLLAGAGYLLLLYLLIFYFESDRHYFVFYFVAGVMFAVYGPTGLTFLFGSGLLLLGRVRRCRLADVTFLIKVGLAFTAGASPFLLNYLLSIPATGRDLSPEEQKILYAFWQWRFPEDYPIPIWKLLVRGFPRIGWLAHVPLVLLTGLGVWAWLRHSVRGQIAFLYGIVLYIFVFKAIPYVLLAMFFLHLTPDEQLRAWRGPIERLFVLSLGLWSVTTWGELAMNMYYKVVQRPPFFIDNPRFMPHLAANAFIVTALLVHYHFFRSRTWKTLISFGTAFVASMIILNGAWGDRAIQAWAVTNDIRWRGEIHGRDPYFEVDDDDYREIVSFGRQSPADSLFIFLTTSDNAWYFRLRARRSIGLNGDDMARKYYMLKHEVVADWRKFNELLESYRERNTEKALDIAGRLGGDYLIFPRTRENEALSTKSGESYVIIPVHGIR